MTAISNDLIEEFCELCNWAFQAWATFRVLFDDNPRAAELQRSQGAPALKRLNTICHEYSLLQIAKLHDPAITFGKPTMGIDYILKYGGWSEPMLIKLKSLAEQLNMFERKLRAARNKVLSHNDLDAVMSNSRLGSFDKNDDAKYFQKLQEFVDLVHDEVIGGPWPFDDHVRRDAAALMAMIKTNE